MLKIQKSRVTKFATRGYPAKHTGKSGYVSTTPRGGAPIPYSFIEEVSSNLYPEARKFVPSDLRDYTDSYYDLRNRQYKYWYDKWGKPHINKWWKGQLDATLRIQKAYETQKDYRQRSNTRSINNGRHNRGKHLSSNNNRIPEHLCCRKCILKYRSSRQGPYNKRRSSYGYRNSRYVNKKYNSRWNR